MSELLIEVLSSVELGYPVRMIEFEVRHGNHRRDVVLDAGRKRAEVVFNDADDKREVQYRYRVYVDPEVAGAEQRFETPVEASDASILIADVSRLMRIEAVRATAVFSADVYRVAFVDVRVRTAGQPIEFTLEVDKERHQMARAIVLPAGAPLDLQTRIRHVKWTGELIEGPWQATDRFMIVAANPVNQPVTA
jgi:hypothetical protein